MFKLNSQKTINDLEKNFVKKDLPIINIGDNVKIGVKIIEGNKERIQFYEGTVIAKKNSSINTTITVRKILQGIGVERIFLVHSPKVDSISYFTFIKSATFKTLLFKKFKRKSNSFKTSFLIFLIY